jgi:hypothetical protein
MISIFGVCTSAGFSTGFSSFDMILVLNGLLSRYIHAWRTGWNFARIFHFASFLIILTVSSFSPCELWISTLAGGTIVLTVCDGGGV